MSDLITLQFKDIVYSRKVLMNNFKKVCERLSVLLAEKLLLYNEFKLVSREINRLTKEKQRPLSEKGERNLGLKIQDLEKKMKLMRSEEKDLEIVIYEYINNRQEIWEEIKKSWHKQCEIWEEINQRIQN